MPTGPRTATEVRRLFREQQYTRWTAYDIVEQRREVNAFLREMYREWLAMQDVKGPSKLIKTGTPKNYGEDD